MIVNTCCVKFLGEWVKEHETGYQNDDLKSPHEMLQIPYTLKCTKCDSRWTRGDQETWIKRDDDPDYTPSTYTTNADDKDDEEMAGLGALFG